ncbi:MAG: hypothetical protein UT24_C0018G0002 [Candidatus Woesebacteria bacterium GW2011_GWB1_39_12]|uniref:Uncharacterized protein n=1 Tax=Candidatus Woesebacteria bacterium GW2011_GWB1_39_12 TaxID=1618574 RepID=A0A0G0PPC5_9BACT|nr:MAG: hypothetical protein UT24_C0018G0002 [Candidatus Woesebacteria bacterium GW2011_GWB1_39_12]
MENFLETLEKLDRGGQYEESDVMMAKFSQSSTKIPDNIWDIVGRWGGKFMRFVREEAPSVGKWLDSRLSAQDEVQRAKGMLDPLKKKIMDTWEGGSAADRTMSYQMDEKGRSMIGAYPEMKTLKSLYDQLPVGSPMEAAIKGAVNGYAQHLGYRNMEDMLRRMSFGGSAVDSAGRPNTAVGDVIGE